MVKQLCKLDTSAITRIFEDWFYEHGQPLRLRTDNRPQFRTKFDEWCESMGIVHEKSSPEHHESNGHVESAVKEMKKLLEKIGTWKKFQQALTKSRNTQQGQRTSCPALPSAYDHITDKDLKKSLSPEGGDETESQSGL